MAFPESLSEISTNLSSAELADVVKAVEEERVNWVPGSSSVFAGSSGGSFDYKGARYELNEWFELVTSLHLVQSEQRELPISKVTVAG